MAGRPKTRAREAAAAGKPASSTTAPEILDAVPAPLEPPQRTHARTHAREAQQPPTPTRRAPMGPAARNVVDEQQAQTVRTLAAQLRPGMRIRIERVRPQWCSGWLEDVVLARGEGFGFLLEHIREDYGGHSYLLQVLGAGDVVLYEGGLQVAGPPMADGQVINRARWEGRDVDDEQRRNNATPATPATPVAGFNMESALSLATLVLGAFQKHQSEQMGAVRDMVTQSRELVVAALGQREQNANKTSFASQLGEIVEATRGIEKVKRQLFGSAAQQRTTGDDAEPEDETKFLVREAGKAFLMNAMGSFMGGGPATPARPQPTPVRAVSPVRNGRKAPETIPNARPAGHIPGKN